MLRRERDRRAKTQAMRLAQAGDGRMTFAFVGDENDAAIGAAQPEDTIPTRAFSGRLGRAIATGYVKAANAPNAPKPAPYPV